MAQDAGVEPDGACQRFQAQNEEFIILEERQQGHMQGHVQRDDAFPFARLPRKTGHQVDGPQLSTATASSNGTKAMPASA